VCRVLANGGASIGDIFGFIELPIYLASWTVGAFNGPAIGPVISGFAVQAKGWRWGLWEVVWLCAPIFVVFFFLYPETSADNILRRRAERLRKLTGATNIKSQSEINQAQMNAKEVAFDALIKPIEIMIRDPAIAFTNAYVSSLTVSDHKLGRLTNGLQTALVYGIYYSFFEAFPLVYPVIYNFNLGEVGLVFLSISVACFLAVTIFILYQVYYLIPDIKKNGLRAPEHRLVPALLGVIILPAGFFMFGWTARQGVPWIVSVIGVAIVVLGNFFIFQSVFIYLPLSYPKYAASLFAANDLARSMFAAGCVLFARPMFINLGIGGGVSLLAGLSCLGIFGMFYLQRYGAWLRSKSSFAVSS
jgi:MFS transporter, DHA1 family, multidrug resistance protein